MKMKTITHQKRLQILFFLNSYVLLLVFARLLQSAEATLSTPMSSNIVERLPEGMLTAEIRLSARCRHDIFVYMTHLQSGADWAMKMFDSTGKIESGVMTGGRTFLGLYSECVEALPEPATRPAPKDYSQHLPSFTSTYCLTSMHLDFDQSSHKQGYFFVGNLVLAFAVAAVLSLTIEIPFRRLEKLLLENP